MSDDKVNGFWIDVDLDECSISYGRGDFSEWFLSRRSWQYCGDSTFSYHAKNKDELKGRSIDFIQEKINLLTNLLDDIDSL